MESKYDLIEKYLMNEMSVRDQVEFEESLRNDPDLMKEFLLRKKVNEAILEDDIINLRNTLNHITKNKSCQLSISKKLYFYSSIAAAIVLLVVVSSIFFKPFGKTNNTEIFHVYYNVYPAIIINRSSSNQTEIENFLYDAFENYNRRDFHTASDYLTMVIKLDNTNYMSQFYLSICEIEKGNYRLAEKYLNELILNGDHIFVEQSYWYLALIYLKQNKISKAENVLNKMIDEDMTQKSDAESILKKLK
ncbi:hypothetical protein ACFLSE_04595 [Bacteroidota bacterium]